MMTVYGKHRSKRAYSVCLGFCFVWVTCTWTTTTVTSTRTLKHHDTRFEICKIGTPQCVCVHVRVFASMHLVSVAEHLLPVLKHTLADMCTVNGKHADIPEVK